MSYAGTNQFERFTAGGATFTNNALGVGAETTGTATTYYRRDNEGGLVSERLATTGNPIYYYAYDGLGSVAALTDSAGAVPALYRYEPYGETTVSGPAPGTHNPWRYMSSYFDSAIGFYKMGLRYYRPELMRWTQQDALEAPLDPVQANRYGYAAGNPINMADPDGDFALPLVGAAALFTATAVATGAAIGTYVIIRNAAEDESAKSTTGPRRSRRYKGEQKAKEKKKQKEGWQDRDRRKKPSKYR